jgi:hypothetical protein
MVDTWLGVGKITSQELDTPTIAHIHFHRLVASRHAVCHCFPFAPHCKFTYTDNSPPFSPSTGLVGYIIPSRWYLSDALLDYQRRFRLRSRISSSSSIIGLEPCSLHSRGIPMRMENRCTAGRNPVTYNFMFTLTGSKI